MEYRELVGNDNSSAALNLSYCVSLPFEAEILGCCFLFFFFFFSKVYSLV